MKLKIVSAGTSMDTKVIDVETGLELKGIAEVSWSCRVAELAEVRLRLVDVPIEVEGFHGKEYTIAGRTYIHTAWGLTDKENGGILVPDEAQEEIKKFVRTDPDAV